MAIEEPKYQLLTDTGRYEIRRCLPYIVAEVDVSGPSRDCDGLRALARFIFGDNDRREKMRMTAPVETRRASTEGTFSYAFVMEGRYTLQTLPKPGNPDIRLREKSDRIVAVRKFSGRWSDRIFDSHAERLLRDLADDGTKTIGSAELARYNGPTTPWFLRRNEITVPIRWPLETR